MAFYYQLLFYTIRLIAISSHNYTNCQFKLEMMSILPSNNQLTFLWRLVKVLMNFRTWNNTYICFLSCFVYTTHSVQVSWSPWKPLRKRFSNLSIFWEKMNSEKNRNLLTLNPKSPAAVWSPTFPNQNKFKKSMCMFQCDKSEPFLFFRCPARTFSSTVF